LLVADVGVERSLVYVVVDEAGGPVGGLAKNGGVEVADAGNVFGPAGVGWLKD